MKWFWSKRAAGKHDACRGIAGVTIGRRTPATISASAFDAKPQACVCFWRHDAGRVTRPAASRFHAPEFDEILVDLGVQRTAQVLAIGLADHAERTRRSNHDQAPGLAGINRVSSRSASLASDLSSDGSADVGGGTDFVSSARSRSVPRYRRRDPVADCAWNGDCCRELSCRWAKYLVARRTPWLRQLRPAR
jgi:hypothetical protein